MKTLTLSAVSNVRVVCFFLPITIYLALICSTLDTFRKLGPHEWVSPVLKVWPFKVEVITLSYPRSQRVLPPSPTQEKLLPILTQCWRSISWLNKIQFNFHIIDITKGLFKCQALLCHWRTVRTVSKVSRLRMTMVSYILNNKSVIGIWRGER